MPGCRLRFLMASLSRRSGFARVPYIKVALVHMKFPRYTPMVISRSSTKSNKICPVVNLKFWYASRNRPLPPLPLLVLSPTFVSLPNRCRARAHLRAASSLRANPSTSSQNGSMLLVCFLAALATSHRECAHCSTNELMTGWCSQSRNPSKWRLVGASLASWSAWSAWSWSASKPTPPALPPQSAAAASASSLCSCASANA
mmetsp:Transcript_9403/g.18878  ORF Transcript_9403/g.18878 Transcript_9403/m.18878 type:complete len:201 (-) Transcript_9403:421-1023(-)